MKVSIAWRACLHAKCFSRIWLFATLWIVDCQAPLSMGFSSQEYRTELLCLSPKDLPDSGVEPMFPAAPAALQANSLLRATREAPIPWQMPNKHEFPVTCCLVTQPCPTLCNPMNRSTPGLPLHHQLPEFTQIHVHRVSDAIQPSHPLSSPSPPAPNPSQHQSFPMSQFFTWSGQSIGVSALASVLPKNTQGSSPLEWTGWISLQSKGLYRVFSNITVQKHQFFGTQLSLQSNSQIHTWPLEKP